MNKQTDKKTYIDRQTDIFVIHLYKMHWTELSLLGTRVRVNTPSGMANTSPLAFMASHVYAPWSPSFTSRIVSVPRPFSLVILILQSKTARKREHKRKRLFELDLLNIGYYLKAKL